VEGQFGETSPALEISSSNSDLPTRRSRIGRIVGIDPVKRSVKRKARLSSASTVKKLAWTSRQRGGELAGNEASVEKRRVDAHSTTIRNRSPTYICYICYRAPDCILIGEDLRGTLRRLAHRAGGSRTYDERCRVLRSDVATTPFCGDWYCALLSASTPSSLLIAAP